ncbi:PREDICTED: pinin-like [Diuraphis noxia]|uniref:pinin-like n=1 Tax=Diuraphis noxia TaxID=143948 RepID=UPI0007639743|nr:PREDICTED: pinin-like [Diuraphis noxia]
MDGERTNDVNVEDSTTEFATISLSLDFDVPETVVPEIVVDNAPVEVEPEPEPQPQLQMQPQPEQELIVVLEEPCVSAPAPTVTAIRLGSGADDNLSTSVSDVESENMDNRSQRNRSRRNRSRRSRSRRSRSRRSRNRRSSSRSSLSRHTRSDDSEFSVHIDEDEIGTELMAGSSRGGQKTIREGRRARKAPLVSRRGGNVTRGSHTSKKSARGIRSDQQLARGIRGGRKTAKNAPPRASRTVWNGRLRSQITSRKKLSKAK